MLYALVEVVKPTRLLLCNLDQAITIFQVDTQLVIDYGSDTRTYLTFESAIATKDAFEIMVKAINAGTQGVILIPFKEQ